MGIMHLEDQNLEAYWKMLSIICGDISRAVTFFRSFYPHKAHSIITIRTLYIHGTLPKLQEKPYF